MSTGPASDPNPSLTYNFRVKWEGKFVAAATQVSGLAHPTAVVSVHAGGRPQSPFKIPGQTDYGAITLKHGVITDSAFEQWAIKTWSYPSTSQLGTEISLQDFRTSLQLEVYDPAGRPVLRYDIHNCWPSDYTAMPELDPEETAVPFASLTIEHEGWDRVDLAAQPPSQG